MKEFYYNLHINIEYILLIELVDGEWLLNDLEDNLYKPLHDELVSELDTELTKFLNEKNKKQFFI